MISVVMPVRNTAGTLGRQLEALLAQDYTGPWEIIVADNGSSDRTANVAQTFAKRIPHLRLVDASRRRGCGAARNDGVRAATGDVLLFCDGDDTVEPSWVSAYAEAASRDPWDVAGGPALPPPNSARGATGARPFLPGPQDLGWLPYATGANLAASRCAFDAIGGFEEALLRGQDVDFCWRAQVAGMSFRCVPDARVIKYPRATPRQLWAEHVAWGETTVELFQRHRRAGMPRSSVVEAMRTYAWSLARVRALHEPAARREWARFTGARAGRLRASLRSRTRYL